MKSIEEYGSLEEYILDFCNFNQKNKYYKITRNGDILIKTPSYILELAYIYFKGYKKSKEFFNFEDIVKLKTKKISRHSSLEILEVEDRFFRALFNRDGVHALSLGNELLLRDSQRFFDIVYLNAKLSRDPNRLIKIYLFEMIFNDLGLIYSIYSNLISYITNSMEGYGDYEYVDDLVAYIYNIKFKEKLKNTKDIEGLNKFLLEVLKGEI